MTCFQVIGAEAICAILLTLVFAFYDERIRRWEDRKIRKVKRWVCRKLAEDGIWAEPKYNSECGIRNSEWG